ncbi:MAG: c-type cytochrome [Gammaproteobacteria bacterium]|nr:c-type cytochrome [Gammaproteobacteria bacterium]
MLKWLIRVVLGLLGAAAIAVVSSYVYFFVVLPRDLPPPDLQIELTPARVERGTYLATAVFGCAYCHSDRDWSLFGAPPKPGTIGQGGELFDESAGLSGMIVSPNITPYALGDWTDGEIYRAIVSGLHKDGYAFFPIMPFDVYLYLEPEDAYALVAWVRSLEPVVNDTPPRNPSLFMQWIGNVRAIPAAPWEIDKSDPVQRGQYLAVIAGCRFCHTPADERQQALPGMRLAGGLGMPANGVKVYSANITPDRATGIGGWSERDFINRFHNFRGATVAADAVGFQTQHAWTEYAQMTAADLADIYAYLMAQPAVSNSVDPLLGMQP